MNTKQVCGSSVNIIRVRYTSQMRFLRKLYIINVNEAVSRREHKMSCSKISNSNKHLGYFYVISM